MSVYFLSCFEQEKRRHLERKYFEVLILTWMTGRYLIQRAIARSELLTLAKKSEILKVIFVKKKKQMKCGFKNVPEMNELLS